MTTLIVDAHLDLAWNAIDWNRDLTRSITEVRKMETEPALADHPARGKNTVTFPELRKGGIYVMIATLLARLFRPHSKPPFIRYSSMEMAHAAARGQSEFYQVMEQKGILKRIDHGTALESFLENIAKEDNYSGPLGYILSMEGADPILSPEDLRSWYDLGLRIIGPAHYGVSPYAHGTGTVGGLFERGPILLKEMERLGIILDITHLSDQCFDEALDIYSGPVLASHHNCRTLVPDQRQLSDPQIKRLIARKAVIGVAFDAWMLYPNWVRGETTPQSAQVTLAKIVDHIDHICQLSGNCDHVGIGSDLDGGFGKEQSPIDLETIADLQKVLVLLKERGYSQEDVEKIASRNWIRFFLRSLPKK